jgi:hypothetical protein
MKRPIASGANAISGHAVGREAGAGWQTIERYSMIVPVYEPVHQRFVAGNATLTLWWASAAGSRLAVVLVHDRPLLPSPATDASSQLRRLGEEPVATGVVNVTLNVVVGVPRAGVTATGARGPKVFVACAAVAAPATVSASTTIRIPSRLITRLSLGPQPRRSRYI